MVHDYPLPAAGMSPAANRYAPAWFEGQGPHAVPAALPEVHEEVIPTRRRYLATTPPFGSAQARAALSAVTSAPILNGGAAPAKGARSLMGRRGSMACAELTMLHRSADLRKAFPAHVNERFVIPGLEIDIRLFVDACIHDNIEPVGPANRRNGTRGAVGKQGSDLPPRQSACSGRASPGRRQGGSAGTPAARPGCSPRHRQARRPWPVDLSAHEIPRLSAKPFPSADAESDRTASSAARDTSGV